MFLTTTKNLPSVSIEVMHKTCHHTSAVQVAILSGQQCTGVTAENPAKVVLPNQLTVT